MRILTRGALNYTLIYSVVIVVSSFMRMKYWPYEWPTLVDVANYSLIFVLPISAGLAALQGHIWHGTLEVNGASAKKMKVVAAAITPVVVGFIFGYLIALGSMAITLGVLATWHSPNLYSFATAIPTVLLVILACLMGFYFGRKMSSPAAMGLFALATFGIIMVSYITGITEPLISTGGATGSLVGLKYSALRLSLQTLTFVIGIVTLIVVLVWPRRSIPKVVLLGAFGVAALTLVIFASDRYEKEFPDLACSTLDGVEACAAPGYAKGLDAVLEQDRVFRDRANEIGIDVPKRLSQISYMENEKGVYASADSLIGRELIDSSSYANLALPPECDPADPSRDVFDAYLAVNDFLTGAVDTTHEEAKAGVDELTNCGD